jgi:flagellar motility protein MotE (MotC chaperone)
VSRIPRLLPLVGVAIGGVLAVKAVTTAPQIWGATQAFAEDVVHPGQSKSALPPNASILSGDITTASASRSGAPAAVCAPTAAELAKEAGLSPAELQVLQSLSNRRGELDQREMSLDTQVQLIAAAEAKLDSRIADMNKLKSDIQGLLGQADQQQKADQDRLVRVYEDMDPKKAAAAMSVMDDAVRIPIAANMKERKLAAILQAMLPADAKALTEKLAQRMAGSPVIANAKAALNPNAQPPAQPPAQAAGQPANTQSPTGQAAADATAAKTAKTLKTGKAAKTDKGAADNTTADASQADATAKAAPAKTHRTVHAKVRPKVAPANAAAQAGKATPTTQVAQPAAVAVNAVKGPPAAGKTLPAGPKTPVPPIKTIVAPPVPPNAKIG